MINYERINAIRVPISPDGNVYALIVTDDEKQDYYLIHKTYGDPVFMFAIAPVPDEEAVYMAAANAILYIPEDWE